MDKFILHSPYQPTGDQPQAIEALVKGFEEGNQFQTLLGVTGSGKTFTMANVIARLNKPTLIISHNKTLAAQLYGEFKEFFPENARLLTMVAIAKELSAVGVRKAEIVLAVGLPFSDYGREKKDLIKYYEEKASMKIVGALLAGVNGGVSTENTVESQSEIDTQLPEQSTDLPNGAFDFLR